MASGPRALIIAIENYPGAQGLAASLPGTVRGGLDFYGWLRDKKAVPAENIHVCCNEAWTAGHPANRIYAAKRDAIKDAILDLISEGQDKTTEFFCFFSGHGVALRSDLPGGAVDVLVASDFRNIQISGDRCIRFDELVDVITVFVGGSDLYFFVDACRNVLPNAAQKVASLAIDLENTAQLTRPNWYKLQSTVPGEVAAIHSGFSDALLKGLNGAGRAKGFDENGDIWVKFDLLASYVKKEIRPQETDGPQNGPGLMYQVPPPVESECKVHVEDAGAAEEFDFTIRLGITRETRKFTGPDFSLALPPATPGYRFELRQGGAALEQSAPASTKPLDLFEPVVLKFRKSAGGLGSASPPAPPPLRRLSAVGAVRMRNVATGERMTVHGSEELGVVRSGRWSVELPVDGRVVRKTVVDIDDDSPLDLDLDTRVASRAAASIESQLPANPGTGLPQPSETLADLAERDPAMWLSLLAGSRVLAPRSTFSKLRKFEVASFDDVGAGVSSVYLIGAIESEQPLYYFLDEQYQGPLLGIEGIDGAHHIRVENETGAHLVSIAMPGTEPPLTFPTWLAPDRVTVAVFEQQGERLELAHQYLLPVHHLSAAQRLNIRPWEVLRIIRMLCTAQKQFRDGKVIRPGARMDRPIWDRLTAAARLDPITGVMAALDALGRDRAGAKARRSLAALRKQDSALPDVDALAGLLDKEAPKPGSVPILRELLMRSPFYPKRLPYPADRLEYGTPWTCWRGEVTAPGT